MNVSILRDDKANQSLLMAYKSKTEIICSCPIKRETNFMVSNQVYANVQDQNGNTFSFRFDNETALLDFAKIIALIKRRILVQMGKSVSSSLYLVRSKNEATASSGTTLKLKLSAWILGESNSYKLGEPNGVDLSIKLRIGGNNLPALQKILVDAKPGDKLLAICQEEKPNKALKIEKGQVCLFYVFVESFKDGEKAGSEESKEKKSNSEEFKVDQTRETRGSNSLKSLPAITEEEATTPTKKNEKRLSRNTGSANPTLQSPANNLSVANQSNVSLSPRKNENNSLMSPRRNDGGAALAGISENSQNETKLARLRANSRGLDNQKSPMNTKTIPQNTGTSLNPSKGEKRLSRNMENEAESPRSQTTTNSQTRGNAPLNPQRKSQEIKNAVPTLGAGLKGNKMKDIIEEMEGRESQKLTPTKNSGTLRSHQKPKTTNKPPETQSRESKEAKNASKLEDHLQKMQEGLKDLDLAYRSYFADTLKNVRRAKF